MKILVTGACGLLGAHVISFLSRRHEVVGTDRNLWWGDRPIELISGNLDDPAFIKDLAEKVKPDCVIHCAAITNVDFCEFNPSVAYEVNGEATRRLVRAVSPNCLFVYISTDGLFSGQRSLVTENELPSPRTVYGRSKLHGEWNVQLISRRHLIVRTNFYGWSSGRKTTFVEWLYRALEQREKITLFEDFFFTSLYVMDLVERIAALIEGGHQGLFHLTGAERVSKEEFGRQLADLAGFSLENVQRGTLSNANLAADRPRDMSLSSQHFCRTTGLTVPNSKEGLVRFLGDRGRPLSARCGADLAETRRD